MGIDTDVLLKVRDRAALRAALEERSARERARWAADGREADYEKLLAGGYDPLPLLTPLEGGAVSIFTGLRFGDDYGLRCWLEEHFGARLGQIHDDPRGVFVTPDVCEPRAKTYDGIVEELASAGHWIDPSPPTQEERDAKQREFQAFFDGMERLRAAAEDGPAALERALGEMNEDVRHVWTAQNRPLPRPPLVEVEAEADDATEPYGSAGDILAVLKQMMGEDGLAALQRMAGPDDDPRGTGRISAVLPPAVWKVLSERRDRTFDVDEHTLLEDGSALVVTTRIGRDEEDFMGQNLAQVLDEGGFDRASLPPIAFFRESLVPELASAGDHATAVTRLGGRATMVKLRSFQEAFKDAKQSARRWLEE